MRQASERAFRVIAAVATVAIGVSVSPTVEARDDGRHFAPVSAVATTISAAEWQAYRSRFVDPSGRVVDVEKNNVSHSEGQGYGLLIAVRANDRATFDTILRFTLDHMRGRSDGLISWLYNPHSYPRIVDSNNASDGDILIAYALLSAAAKWNDVRYMAVAQPMVHAIGRLLLDERDGFVRLRPAAFGFDPRTHADGPVVNLSYYVYGAFLMFDAIDDTHPWLEAWQSGLQLTEASLAGRLHLTPDWITMRRDRYLEPAAGFAQKSSYDAVRIPLYMALGGRVPSRYFAPFDRAWNVNGNRAPMDYDLQKGRSLADMNDPGYRAVAAVAACASRGVAIPRSLQRFHVRSYFSSSLHLLALSAVRANYPQCTEVPVASSAYDATGGGLSYIGIGSR